MYVFGLALLPPNEVQVAFYLPLDETYEKLFDYLLETYILVPPDSNFPLSICTWAVCMASRQRKLMPAKPFTTPKYIQFGGHSVRDSN